MMLFTVPIQSYMQDYRQMSHSRKPVHGVSGVLHNTIPPVYMRVGLIQILWDPPSYKPGAGIVGLRPDANNLVAVFGLTASHCREVRVRLLPLEQRGWALGSLTTHTATDNSLSDHAEWFVLRIPYLCLLRSFEGQQAFLISLTPTSTWKIVMQKKEIKKLCE
jgi:hypothetical protein